MLPVTSGVSLIFRESTIRRPTPGQANTVSVRTLPPNTPASCVPIIVMIGISAFLKAWDVITIFSGIPFALAFHKNSYVGRTFIKPTQKERESSVKIKLSVLESVVKGKRIVLVDDSIVRGTTISNLITMLRKAGATEVHVRISSPPFLYPCYFGTDVPSNKQLIASSHSTEEIRQQIGADSLGYMPIAELQNMVGDLPICRACFDSHYPMEVPKQDISALLES